MALSQPKDHHVHSRSVIAVSINAFAEASICTVSEPSDAEGNGIQNKSGRGRGRPAPYHTTGHAGPHPAVRQAV